MAKVETGPAVELVYGTGFVEAEHPVTVSARMTAPVSEVLVQEGDRVTRGQPLLLQDDSEQRGLLAQAQAQARSAALAEQRVLPLYRQGWATRAARDEAVAAAAAARASADALRARLNQMTVRAGVSGVVLRRDVEPGDLAMPGKELMQLGDPARTWVTATVDERDIPGVRAGQQVLMSTDALPDRIFKGRVVRITPGGDPDQRAFRVRIGYDRSQQLPFGLTLEVNIVTGRRDRALLIPESALSGSDVWLVRDGRAVRRRVKVGIKANGKAEIRSGLTAMDSVVANPPPQLEDGDRVRS